MRDLLAGLLVLLAPAAFAAKPPVQDAGLDCKYTLTSYETGAKASGHGFVPLRQNADNPRVAESNGALGSAGERTLWAQVAVHERGSVEWQFEWRKGPAGKVEVLGLQEGFLAAGDAPSVKLQAAFFSVEPATIVANDRKRRYDKNLGVHKVELDCTLHLE